MEPITLTAPALAIASIYCLYDAARREREQKARRERRLRERVAFMLWLAAHEAPAEEE